MPDKGYEFFDHTADIGIRATGKTMAELLAHLAQGLVELIAEESVIRPVQERSVALAASTVEDLLFAWLKMVLGWFATDRFLPSAFEFEMTRDTALEGRVKGEPFDPTHHLCGTEVKGITRHALRVEQHDGQWEAQVICDV